MPKNSSRVAVIAGTGVASHFGLGRAKRVKTPYGTAVVFEAKGGGFLVMPRHGEGHTLPPHMVNYRANIAALAELGVGSVIATSAVGSMVREFGVGELGVVGQFLDFTKQRRGTFFDEEVSHTDMTNPYSARLNGELAKAAKKLRLGLRCDLVYVCAEGPRFETAAEIRMFRALGGDVVGMTGVPEVVLAREKGMEYASLVVATNWAAGMQKRVSHGEVLATMKRSGRKARDLIEATIKALGEGMVR
jgi:5'-methylthioadenosine phosphorylase